MNTLIWGFSRQQENIINNLIKENVVIPKFWFKASDEKKCFSWTQMDMRDFLFRDTWQENYLEKIKEYENNVKHNQQVYDYVYKNLYHYINCESRQEKFHKEPVHYYINKFNLLYKFFYSIFVKDEIELCIFSNLNHEGTDVIIFNIAKALGIKTILLAQSSIPNHYDRFFYVEDNEDYGNFVKMQAKLEDANYELKQTTTKDLFYMKKIANDFNDFKLKIPFYKNKKYGEIRRYKKSLEKIVEPVDYTKKYVFFPMHLQPELTTSCLGGIYCDQLLAIERISEIIPKDWIIVIKENPKQTPRMRDAQFFKRLSLIENAKIAPLDENSFQLIQYAQFVSTISGTAGWESLCAGKPVLLFGRTWYQNFEGVFRWSEDFDVNQIIDYSPDMDKLKNDFNKLLSRMPYGVVDPAYIKAIKGFDEKKSQNSVKNVLKELILKK